MIYEILNADGGVENVIVATPEFMRQHYEPGTYREAQAPEPAPVAELRRITVGALFDRFGAAKWAILADGNPGVQAVVKDASVRSYIDLDNPDLPAGLAIVKNAGHNIDPDAIINAPVQDKERPL